MQRAPIPENEIERIAVLRCFDILDTPAEPAYDDIAWLAALICGTSVAQISLVDSDRQWFKGGVGLDVKQMPRDISFCGHAINQTELFEVPDALLDERFADNPLVTGEPNIRFYAGAPLISADGYALGSLFVVDTVPRKLNSHQSQALVVLARQATQLIEHRLAKHNMPDTSAVDVARQRLRYEHARMFETLFVESADPKLIIRRGRIVDCNTSALQQFACRHKSELINRTLLQLSVDDGIGGVCVSDRLLEFYSLALRKKHLRFQWQMQRLDGMVFHADVALSAVTLNDELLLYVVLRDITDYVVLQQALRSRTDEMEAIFQTSCDGLAVLDLESRFLEFNPAYLQMTGFTREELLQTSCIALSAPEDVPRSIAALQQVIETGFVENYEKTCILKHGKRVQVNMSVALMPDKKRLLMNTRDVTMRKQMERELYLAKERAEITLASIGDAVIVTDDQERILFLNHVAITLTGWALEEAVGQNIQTVFHIVHEETRLMLPSPVAQVLCHKKTVLLSNHAVLVARDGMEYFIEDSAAPIFNKDGSLYGCVLVFHDVTDKHQLINAVNWQANHDVLTRLPNRTLLNDRFKRSLARAQRNKTLLAVCVLDLDDFKPVNDRYGHHVGDLTLIQVAQRLERLVRSDDTVARLGGDEFVLLLNNVRDNQELETIVLRVLEQVSMPYTIEGSVLHISASVGVTLYPLDNVDADTLIRHADQAMYLAKQRGRNQYLVFDVTQDRHLQSTHQIANQVRTALKSDHLTLYYQPKVNLRTGEIMGMEALLRWIDPERGIIPPLDFLPQIEHSDLIVDIGEWVIDRTLRQLREWNNAGKSWVVSVNIAAYHFQKPEFLDRLKHLLARYPQVAPESLEIEILESVALGDIHHAKQLITDCQALGIQFSLDDFGTGYSSLGYLRRLPANTIKIDQSFVRDILDDRDDLALVEAVISMGKVLNRKVIAEGVETSEHGVLLIRLGCDLAQGYGIARPMPADQVLAWADTFVADPAWSTWADVAWEIKDFPLLVAQQDHLQWVRRLILWVENYHAAFNEQEVADSHACRFGRWYDGEGRQRYGQLAEFLAIAPTHEALHQLGLDIVQYCQSGERQRAIDACSHLLTLKDEIIGYLSVLQKAVVQATSE